jgi:plastocyanin
VTGRKALIALTGAAAVAAAPAALAIAATKGKTRTVTVNDNYYGPSSKLTIHVGDTVKWHWTDEATDVHDVALKSGPKGAPKFASDAMAAGDDFKRKLTKAGTYKIICTFHEEVMKMTITVKKLPTTK